MEIGISIGTVFFDLPRESWVAVFLNCSEILANIVVLALVLHKKTSTKTGLGLLLLLGIANLQAQVTWNLVLGNLSSLDEQFSNTIIILLLGFSLIITFNRYVGKIVCLTGCANIIIIKVLQDDPLLIIYGGIIPVVIIAVSINFSLFRADLDRYIMTLYGKKGPKPVLDLGTLHITNTEWRTIQQLQRCVSTKEIAAIEECTESAIQARIGSIYTKLEVSDRSSLMYKLGQHELIWNEPQN